MLYLGRTWKSKKCSLGCSSWGPAPHPLPRPFSQETWIAAVLGSLSCSGGSKPGSAQSHMHQSSFLHDLMCSYVWASLGRRCWKVAESAGQWGWLQAVRREGCCASACSVQHSAVNGLQAWGHGLSSPLAFPWCPCPCALPHGLLESVQTESAPSASASTCMFEPLMCLGVETSNWHKGQGSWLGDQSWQGAVAHTDGRLCWNRTLIGPEVWRTVYLGVRRVFSGSTKSGWFKQEVIIDSAQMGREASGRALSHHLSFLGCWPFESTLSSQG